MKRYLIELAQALLMAALVGGPFVIYFYWVM